MNSGLPKLSGGIAARERAAWTAPCTYPRCDTGTAVVGVVETITGPRGLCEEHAARIEARGRTVRREPLTRAPRQPPGGAR